MFGRNRIPAALLFVCASLAVTVAPAAAAPDPPTYMLKWGSFGSAPGQFNAPVGVVTDELGHVYVLDQTNTRVQKFDRYGNFITQWGSSGSANGQFYQPSGIATDLSGNVYVADGGNYRIQKFTGSGTYVTQWGSSGSGPGQFTGLGVPATDAAGNVYVPDAHRVQKFTGAGAFVTQWGSLGAGDGQFNGPNSVATDPASNVYVVDRLNMRVQRFTSAGVFMSKFALAANTKDIAVDARGDVYVVDDAYHVTRYGADGTFEIQWGSPGSGDGQFDGARSVDVDPAGNVYVAETFNQRVQKFSGAGATLAEAAPKFLLGWGAYGVGTGEFWGPLGIAVDPAGNVIVVEIVTERVQKFGPTGAYQTHWGLGGGVPAGVATDAAGNVYVTVESDYLVRKFSSTGTPLTQWGFPGTGDGQFSNPYGIAVDPAGNVYVSDRGSDHVQKFTSSGTFLAKWGTTGSGNGQFEAPTGVATDAAGNVYVGDYFNNRIQKFTSAGAYITQWGSTGTGPGQFTGPRMVAVDVAGNVYVTDDWNGRVQKFTGSGAYITSFGSTGTGEGQFTFPGGVATDAAGNVYVADTQGHDIQKFATAPVVALASDVRNDQGRQARLRILRASADVAGSGATVTGYAIYRRIDPPPAGASPFARDAAGPASATIAGWDYVTTIPARGDAEYNAVVPTLVDATGASPNYSAFMVSALTPSPTSYYDSVVESGYSIDNLSPPAPTPFLAAYAAGATHLHWGVSTAPDFAAFRLYRGSSADFVPGTGNFVTTTTDTGYVDVGGAGSYYKLAAVDLNGNVSPYALAGPQQTTDVPGESALEFALDEIRPNPVRGRDLSVRFSLATAEAARLELIDVAGRRVDERTVTGAGSHMVELGRARTLGSGIYFVKLSQGARSQVGRVVILE